MGDIDPNKATPSNTIGAGTIGAESPETTHFSVIDQQGNAVSNTYTLNTAFGCKVVIPGTGILLNNEMDDFSAKPGAANVYGLVQGARNKIEPKKRMLSSMTPTIITKDDRVRAVVGTPGGSTITTTVAQIVRALLDYDIPLQDAVQAPRMYHQYKPDLIFAEPAITDDAKSALEARGHTVNTDRWKTIGHAHCIEVDPRTGHFRAVADITRGDGSALAY
jgi:gamma-glutamyltranspeptidase/glutathione hydrolase